VGAHRSTSQRESEDARTWLATDEAIVFVRLHDDLSKNEEVGLVGGESQHDKISVLCGESMHGELSG
jgi:hypothetical protein